MTAHLYGIPNCGTIKKARAWLDEQGVAYQFHDYKREGVDAARLAGWVDRLGWERLLNRSGTTFRNLPEADRAVADRDGAIALMCAHPSLIRRPVLETGETIEVGFAPDRYTELFASPGAPSRS